MTASLQLRSQLLRPRKVATRRHRNRRVISSTSLRPAPALLARRVLQPASAASLDSSSRQSSDHLYKSTALPRLWTQQQSCQRMYQWAPCGACLIIASELREKKSTVPCPAPECLGCRHMCTCLSRTMWPHCTCEMLLPGRCRKRVSTAMRAAVAASEASQHAAAHSSAAAQAATQASIHAGR